MKIPDANVLMYARNTQAAQHATASWWIEEALSGAMPVGFPVAVLLAFVRLTTNPRVWDPPLTIEEAFEQVAAWLAPAPARMVEAGDDHLERVRGLLTGAGGAGKLTADAHLAAIAIEHRATLCSFDDDFRRFHGLEFEYLQPD